MIRLHALGVGDTFTEQHHTHGLLVEADGFRLAIDCPDSYRRVLRDARTISGADLDLATIDDVLITHLHGDHMNGLEGVAFFKRFAQQRRLGLHTIGAVRADIWDRRLVAGMSRLWDGTKFVDLSFDDYFAHTEVSLDQPTKVGPFTIRARRTTHHIPTSALLVEHGGRTVGISSDTAFDPDLIAWLGQADLIVHETNHGPAHTAYKDLLTVERSVRDKMHLIHYPDTFEVAASEIAVLREGDVLDV